jgi:SAM-dependent methyltransferase
VSVWSEGYVSDIGYTYGYYPELNPLRVRLALLHAGWHVPEVKHACDMGFGQGISINVHAAASGVQWLGTDFNPAQVSFAAALAQAAGTDVRLDEQAFADYCARTDLPELDFIGLHGIWSWVSEVNRQVLVDWCRRKLRPGGVLYLGYNAMPGWASAAPLQRLMADRQKALAPPGDSQAAKVEASMAFVDALMAARPAFAAALPEAARKFDALKPQDRNYLAHEYFNQNWSPMYFGDVATQLAPAKLQYACSARYLDHIDALNLTAAQHGLLAQIPDPVLRETTRDFIVNQQFRKDYWVKGARRMSPIEQSEALRQQRVVLAVPRAEVTLQVTGALGAAQLNESVYTPLLDAMADHGVRSLGELEPLLAPRGIGFAALVQAVMVLVGQGALAPAQDEPATVAARPACQRLNQHLMQQARAHANISTLASPVTGGGVGVSRSAQLMVLAVQQGHRDAEACARQALQMLRSPGDNAAPAANAEQLALLTTQARQFLARQWPMLQALQVV